MYMLTAPENWIFGSAVMLLVGLAVLEGLGLLFAMSPSQWLDHLLPELPDDGVFGWMHLGKVPVLVLLVLFLAGFSLTGYVAQNAAFQITGHLLPTWMASIPSVLAGMATVKALGAMIEKIIPGDETYAVSITTLIGRSGLIVVGHARKGLAAEAKVYDVHGNPHYVRVEPDIDTEILKEGSSVLLVRQVEGKFFVIANPHPTLI